MGLARAFEAAAQGVHEVDDVGGLGRGSGGDGDLAAGELVLDELPHLFLVGVVPVLGLPFDREHADQLLGGFDLLGGELGFLGQVADLGAGGADLVGEVHGVQLQEAVLGARRGQVLLAAGAEVVGLVEEDRVDVGEVDEAGDVGGA